ncbi:MAG: type II toxin-antitoxin system HicB family antitoxin [Syntrophobacteraceae bacterium]
MALKPEEYLKQPYARVLIPNEDSTFSAELLEFPGCFSQGKTSDEALRNLEDAARGWIEAALDLGQEIPAPSVSHGYTGKIALRLPKSIHKKAIQLAQRDGISLNQFLLSAISARVGAEDLYSYFSDKFEKQHVAIQASCRVDFSKMQTVTIGPETHQAITAYSTWSGSSLLCNSESELLPTLPPVLHNRIER